MGKQTTGILKKKAEKLYSMYPIEFGNDFEKNKEILNSTGLFDYSKSDRNIVAGYISRLATEQIKKED
ncbi:MAG: 30S ribosomal protein S17e [Candidatus Diapherotrites archaeon]|nr:30S ribosomal protein S17e [Candidatus Diapherotrites archaeon]